MEGDMKEPGKDLNELQNSDWVRTIVAHTLKMNSVTALKLYDSADKSVHPRPVSGCR